MTEAAGSNPVIRNAFTHYVPLRVPFRALAVATGLSAAYLFLFCRVLWRVGDEGSIVYGAVRVANGEVPYRDFVDVMGPGSFYWLAGWFVLFGKSWMALRTHLLLTWVAISVTLYFLTRRIHAGPFATLPCLVFVVVGVPLWPASSHHWDSLLFALLSFVCFLHWQTTRRGGWLLGAGTLAAVTTCIIPQKGAALMAAALVMVAGSGYFTSLSRAGRDALLLIASYAGTLIAVAISFYSLGALDDLLYTTVVWPMTDYRALNRVGYAFNALAAALTVAAGVLKQTDWLLPCVTLICLIPLMVMALLPAIAAVIVAYTGLQMMKRRLVIDDSAAAYALFGLALAVSELHRPDINHLMWGSTLLMSGAVAAATRLAPPRPARFVLSLFAAAVFVSGTFSAARALKAHDVVATRRGSVRVPSPDRALEFIVSHVRASADLFVYPYYPMYYYLADVHSASRYSILVYHYNTPAQFDEVIRALDRSKVEYVLWDTLVHGENMKRWFPGYTPPDDQPLEQYLNRHYDEIEIENGFRIMRRRP